MLKFSLTFYFGDFKLTLRFTRYSGLNLTFPCKLMLRVLFPQQVVGDPLEGCGASRRWGVAGMGGSCRVSL